MGLSDWTEVKQERFQMVYAGMREKQQAQYPKMLNITSQS